MSVLVSSWEELTVRQVIPHRGQMVLIDEIHAFEPEGSIVCHVHVGVWSLFHNEEGVVPAYVGMEYMAQSIAAYFGVLRRLEGKSLDVGFLLGTRRMYIGVDAFQPRQQLTVTASKVYDYNGMGVFDCHIIDSTDTTNTPMVEGKINVYRPSNLKEYLEI